MTTPNDLSNLHQQSINEFLIHGGIIQKECTYKSHNHQLTARFIRDSLFLSHPISPIIYQDLSYINYSVNPSSIITMSSFECINSLSQYLSHLCISKLSVDDIKLLAGNKSCVRDHKYGLNSIVFDHHGALFATGGSNGLIRVYDFDECQSGMQLRKGEINPVVSFDTKKDVSSIAWSYNNEDDIAIAFTYRPEIQIYDLSTNVDNMNNNNINNQGSNCFNQNTPYKRMLDICGNSKSGGHNVVIYFPIIKNTNQVVVSEEPVIAGSSNGYIRYWNSHRNPKNYIWSVLADPLRSSMNASPVVALLLLYNSSYHIYTDDVFRSKRKLGKMSYLVDNNKNMNNHLNSSAASAILPLLLSATAQGVLVIWNVSNLRATSFGSSNPEPQSLKRIDYTTQLLLFDPIKLIGITSYNMSQEHCSLLAATTDNVFLSISNGELYLVDLAKETFVMNNAENIDKILNISRSSTISSHSDSNTSLRPRLKDPNQLREYQAVTQQMNDKDKNIVINRYCSATFPNWMKNTAIVSKSLNGNITLNMYDLSKMNYNSYKSIVTYPNTITGNGLYSVSGKSSDTLTGIVRSNMRRCSEVSCTLPGYIMFAEPGSYEIITSQDLQSYLTHEAAVQSCYNKTHEIQFDWSCFNPSHKRNKSYRSEYNNVIDESGVPITRSINTVIGMGYNNNSNPINTGNRGHHITLSSRYVGPIVRNGIPRVYIRCNLLPGSRTLSELSGIPRKQVTSIRSTDGWLCKERVLTSDYTEGRVCTVTVAHPYFPALVAGLDNEEIILIVPHNYHLDLIEEEANNNNNSFNNNNNNNSNNNNSNNNNSNNNNNDNNNNNSNNNSNNNVISNNNNIST